ncbi:dUTP diphosphatase [Cytobacillus sp. FJAT-54145]|uniref:dUTP diphosphatase n=1 Tax=Cytobacillus spartinae TaxID=3299023 RepID=A0ABW6KHN8_9BACI
MNLQKLFEMQKGLDQHIEQNHNLENENLFDRKVLALLVEIGELANETRCFKFWSVKPSSPQATILEEFVDGIHFMLSLGIETGLSEVDLPSQKQSETEVSMNEQFLKVFGRINDFRTTKSREHFERMIQDYMMLANLLGFSNEDIEQAYISKNEVNYKRQQEGY